MQELMVAGGDGGVNAGARAAAIPHGPERAFSGRGSVGPGNDPVSPPRWIIGYTPVMAMLFPGMDPYLEDHQIWAGVHASFIVYLRDHIQPQVRPRYIATVEERVYVEGPEREVIPDVWLRRNRPEAGGPEPAGRAVSSAKAAISEADAPVLVQVPEIEVHEAYVSILDHRSGGQVVTVIEVLSPTNKYPGPGHASYRTKQKEVLSSTSHLVEVDLLRAGPHVLAVPEWLARKEGPYDYLVSVNRAGGLRDLFELYPRRLAERLPRVRIPLAAEDPDAVLDLQAVLERTYEEGAYRDRIDYSRPCRPALSPADQAWADGLVRVGGG